MLIRQGITRYGLREKRSASNWSVDFINPARRAFWCLFIWRRYAKFQFRLYQYVTVELHWEGLLLGKTGILRNFINMFSSCLCQSIKIKLTLRLVFYRSGNNQWYFLLKICQIRQVSPVRVQETSYHLFGIFAL